MNLRYELRFAVPPPVDLPLVADSDDYDALRIHLHAYLRTLYGPGPIYADGWRFVHQCSPNFACCIPPYPPRVGQTHAAAGPVDAVISLIVMPDAIDTPRVALVRLPPAPLPPPVNDWRPEPPVEVAPPLRLIVCVWLLTLLASVLIAYFEGGAP